MKVKPEQLLQYIDDIDRITKDIQDKKYLIRSSHLLFTQVKNRINDPELKELISILQSELLKHC